MNRQYANVYELALVPVSAPGQIMQEFNVPDGASAANYYADDPNSRRLPFSHLLNWFQPPTANINDPPMNAVQPFLAPSAIFELTTTGSPWADANKYLPAASVVSSPAARAALASLHAPYNQISRFVEPGRVNINTIQDPRVWQGLVWNVDPTAVQRETPMPAPEGTPGPPGWSQLVGFRRGYAPRPGSAIPEPNPRLSAFFPTQFNGVFKSPFEAGFTPQIRGSAPLEQLARINPINTTLARADGSLRRPLFALPGASQSNAFNEFQYFARLKKLTTTRSMVFAIRATIGYFEYDPRTGLGIEYGSDTGTSRRHRGFYVVDRSIPVGYQEGQDHNVEDCILVRRIIE
jgi:hypothetical protein